MSCSKPLLFAFFGALLFLSCSDDFKAIDRLSLEDWLAMGGSSSSGEQEIGSIVGVSQKGPFRKGASVVLSELDNNLVQSGRTFQAQIEEDDGSFEIKGIKLVSPYVLISVDGFYLNEVTGLNSGTKITLYAILDVTGKSSANINLMSHLEFHRVQVLANKGRDLAAAKKQAQGEILAVFGINSINFKDSEDMSIFGTSESDAALLAISVLLQNNLSEANFSVLLADFSQRIKASGVWDNEAKKTEIADWAFGVDLGSIRSNIVGWGMSSDVPPFEKHVRNYWAMSYGLGVCGSANDNVVKENANLLSVNKGKSYVCKGGFWKAQSAFLCDGSEYEPETQFCYNNYIVEKCGGKEYVPGTELCSFGVVERRCGNGWYKSQTHFCQGGNNIVLLCGGEGGKEFASSQFCRGSEVFSKCNGNEYELNQFCFNYTTIMDKCGGVQSGDAYNPQTEQCCASKRYVIATQFCSNSTAYDKCDGTIIYNPATHFCQSGTTIVQLCGISEYTTSQFCYTDGKVYNKCGSADYNPDTQFCSNNTVYNKCGGTITYTPSTEQCCGSGKFVTATQFCSNNTVYDKCGGTITYMPSTEQCCSSNKFVTATHFCQSGTTIVQLCGSSKYTTSQFCKDGEVFGKCGGVDYPTVTQLCYENSEIVDKCGINPQEYDPGLYQCKPSVNPNGIFLKNPVSHGGESYEAVLIGTQVWMARNLNYDVPDDTTDVCYDNNSSYCVTYGRLYNWATAMDLDSSCNSNTCASQVQSKHRGICPVGWHIPSNAEWNALSSFAEPTFAGTKLKATMKGTSGWNGTDDFGFSALPGGVYYIDASVFSRISVSGYWLTSIESLCWGIDHSSAFLLNYSRRKTDLNSVRCLKDEVGD